MKKDNTRPEILAQIRDRKNELGEQLLILTHHYQRSSIVDLGDFKGDSFDLSRKAANSKASRIVFCGVHFMAESARILCDEHQTVQIPDEEAGCWMSDMADHVMVQRAWDELLAVVPAEKVMPVTYMNSDAVIKAFCGQAGGLSALLPMRARPSAGGSPSVRRSSFFPISTSDKTPPTRWALPRTRSLSGIRPSRWGAIPRRPSNRPGSFSGKHNV